MKHQNYRVIANLCRHGLFWLCSIPVILGSHTIFCQDAELSREQMAQTALNKAINIYDRQLGRNSMIYNGSSYYDPFNSIKNNQFFIDEYWEMGSVGYDGFTYDSIYLMYDIYQDMVLIENFNSEGYLSPIKLYNPKVSWFKLQEFDFIRLENDTVSNMKTGFYNLMYNGENIQVLVKRKKEIVNSNELGSLREEFLERDRYYLKKDGQYYQVRKKGSILKVLHDHKKEIKVFIRSNNLLFKIDPEYDMAEVAEYYDTLL